jgi:hypothetical protein
MSAKSLQKKIDNAHRKISNKLGYDYKLYRPINNSNALDDNNFIDDVKLSFTLSDSYTSALSWQVPVYIGYTTASLVQEGDFLYSEDEGRTFLILSRQPHQPVLVLECPDRISIQSVAYTDTGDGFGPSANAYVAKTVPALVSFNAGTLSGMVPARNNASTGIRGATIITSLPKESMLIGNTIVCNNGFAGDAIYYDYATVGNAVKITAQEYQTP